MKALIIDRVSPVIAKGLQALGAELDIKILPSVDELKEMLPEYDLLVMRVDPKIGRDILDAAAKRVKMIAVCAAGTNHIDLEYARELARAERELRIERWVFISIECKDDAGNPVRLHSYDLPRELHERYRWVVRWREARLQCLYPKRQINTYYSYYDKRTGLRTDFNSALSRLSAAKAQISIAERKEREYLQYQRTNNLFFDESMDEQLVRFREKLRMKKEKYTALEHKIRSEVEFMQKLNRT